MKRNNKIKEGDLRVSTPNEYSLGATLSEIYHGMPYPFQKIENQKQTITLKKPKSRLIHEYLERLSLTNHENILFYDILQQVANLLGHANIDMDGSDSYDSIGDCRFSPSEKPTQIYLRSKLKVAIINMIQMLDLTDYGHDVVDCSLNFKSKSGLKHHLNLLVKDRMAHDKSTNDVESHKFGIMVDFITSRGHGKQVAKVIDKLTKESADALQSTVEQINFTIALLSDNLKYGVRLKKFSITDLTHSKLLKLFHSLTEIRYEAKCEVIVSDIDQTILMVMMLLKDYIESEVIDYSSMVESTGFTGLSGSSAMATIDLLMLLKELVPPRDKYTCGLLNSLCDNLGIVLGFYPKRTVTRYKVSIESSELSNKDRKLKFKPSMKFKEIDTIKCVLNELGPQLMVEMPEIYNNLMEIKTNPIGISELITALTTVRLGNFGKSDVYRLIDAWVIRIRSKTL